MAGETGLLPAGAQAPHQLCRREEGEEDGERRAGGAGHGEARFRVEAGAQLGEAQGEEQESLAPEAGAPKPNGLIHRSGSFRGKIFVRGGDAAPPVPPVYHVPAVLSSFFGQAVHKLVGKEEIYHGETFCAVADFDFSAVFSAVALGGAHPGGAGGAPGGGHGARRGGGASGGAARRAKCRRLHRQEPEAEHSRRRPAAADGYGELSHGGGAGGDARGL